MSGGHFDYKQYQIEDIAEEIERLIRDNDVENEYGYANHFNEETISWFRHAAGVLRLAAVYTHRIDWLVSGDDNEQSFIKRLKEDLERKRI